MERILEDVRRDAMTKLQAREDGTSSDLLCEMAVNEYWMRASKIGVY